MRAVIQRVLKACVKINDEVCGEINKGILILAGFESSDTKEDYKYIVEKSVNLRIFEDNEGKMNLSVTDIGGGILIVPNFTLYGDARKGRRPGFSLASPPYEAQKQFEEFREIYKSNFGSIQTGVFRENMQVSLINDGPVTILLDSKKIF